MSGWLAVWCEVSGCDQDTQTGICKRCGRVKPVETETLEPNNKECATCVQSARTGRTRASSTK